MRILLSGGGTAGHVLPHIAVVERLKSQDRNLKILYLGSAKGPERSLVTSLGWNYRSLPVGKWRRYWDWNNLIDPFKVVAGVMKAIWLVGRFRPEVHFSKGGYASLPVILAGWICKVPLVIHDSDAKPGLTTRLAARFAQKICVGFEAAAAYFPAEKVVVTGTPVRSEILKGSALKGRILTGFSGKKPILLVMGGSLGSQFLNQVLAESLSRLLPITDIIHLTGKGKSGGETSGRSEKSRKGAAVFEYVNEELPHLYALADLVVTRAGANSMAEIQALGKPCLWVPLGPPASHGDQLANANVMVAHGAGACIRDEELSAERLVETVKILLANSKMRKEWGKKAHQFFRENAAQTLADLLMACSMPSPTVSQQKRR